MKLDDTDPTDVCAGVNVSRGVPLQLAIMQQDRTPLGGVPSQTADPVTNPVVPSIFDFSRLAKFLELSL
eukprot:CAMPEP_0184683834 /NCGR_PEP_ID=MMETSP0312-20130426/12751_1 /TAXON_ID=31354 /ORGANISM="Compsopogon coeruleus, Strain SAG 36.94" /LENGTH=68 /DNA_ID=CAMNT_0027136475 /DNA_START=590 /DNA_END=796 /DNA_ORIENTATION=+